MSDNKKFQHVDILKEIAANLPTQRPPEPARADVRPAVIVERSRLATAVSPPDNDPLVQISFSARFSTRKRMFQVARDHDVTLKALILGALREKYPALGIEDADLIDLRTKR
jgi:hypothetical protein